MSAPPAKKMGLSLYADLLEPDKAKAGATISGAPVRYNLPKAGDDSEAGAKKKDAALQFQPIRRPQAQPNKINRPTKKTPTASSSGHAFSSSTNTASLPPSASSPDKPSSAVGNTPLQQPHFQRSNIEDWMGDDDDEFYYENKPKHERGGRKNKNKKKGQQQGGGGGGGRAWSWDDIYDPTLPNNYADYKGSEEQVTEIREWKSRLYYHQMKRGKKSGSAARSEELEKRQQMNSMFAPPANLNFAPPSFDDPPIRPPRTDDDDDFYPPSAPGRAANVSDSYEPPPAFNPPSARDDVSGEDAYTRRMRLSQAASLDPRIRTPPQAAPPPPVVPPVQAPPIIDEKAAADIAAKKAEAAAKIAAFKAKVEAHKAARAGTGAAPSPTPPITAPILPVPTQSSIQPSPPPPSPPATESEQAQEQGTTISRAPVRYQLPPAAAGMPTNDNDDIDTSNTANEEAIDVPRSTRPGQKGFAERLLKKYGWEKGQGLGASGNEGITTAIVAKAEKRKKKSDADGGGWAVPANMGKLVGGKRRKIESETEAADDDKKGDDLPYGPLSAVIKLEGMLTGLDIDDEVQNKDLYGEIGKEMETQYGKVERLFLWRQAAGGNDEVFVKFTSPVSALRAVGACDGMVFAENTVKAAFWDGEKFEQGVYA